jgi:hypothetical protein
VRRSTLKTPLSSARALFIKFSIFDTGERFRERARDLFDISHELLAPEATECSTVSEGSRQTLAALVELVKASQGVRVHKVDLSYPLRDYGPDTDYAPYVNLREVPESLRELPGIMKYAFSHCRARSSVGCRSGWASSCTSRS